MLKLINLLLPRACLLCQSITTESHHLCLACVKDLPILSHYCRKCAQYLPPALNSIPICGACLSDPPPYHQVFAITSYQDPLPKLIRGLKFQSRLAHGRLFSHLLISALKRDWLPYNPKPDLIIPMPLHRTRLKERGYNQAMEIAIPVAKALQIPIDKGVIRHKATQAQAMLSAKERGQNVANAFSTNCFYQGKHLVIIDDVVTTGQTITSLSNTLAKHGATRIDIWCIARCDVS